MWLLLEGGSCTRVGGGMNACAVRHACTGGGGGGHVAALCGHCPALLSLVLPKPSRLFVGAQIAYTKFDKRELREAVAASRRGVRPRLSSADSAADDSGRALRRAFSGGVLYVYLDHATDLPSKSLEGYTKTMRCRVVVGSLVRETECSRAKLVSRRNPVFDQRLELILDGDDVERPGTLLKVELLSAHLLLKPTSKVLGGEGVLVGMEVASWHTSALALWVTRAWAPAARPCSRHHAWVPPPSPGNPSTPLGTCRATWRSRWRRSWPPGASRGRGRCRACRRDSCP